MNNFLETIPGIVKIGLLLTPIVSQTIYMFVSNSRNINKRDLQYVLAICNDHFYCLEEINKKTNRLQLSHANNAASSFFNDRYEDYRKTLKEKAAHFSIQSDTDIEYLIDNVFTPNFISDYIQSKDLDEISKSILKLKRDVCFTQVKLIDMLIRFNEVHIREVLDKGKDFIVEKLRIIYESNSFQNLNEQEFRSFILSQNASLFSGVRRVILDSLPSKGMIVDLAERMDKADKQEIYNLSFDLFNTANNIVVRSSVDKQKEIDRFEKIITNLSNNKKKEK